MFKRKRNAFTLIELIAVLVIMAIIALIATPLVMSIIRKARISADKRSVDAYGRSIELAIAGYLMDTGSFPTSIDQLTIEYSGDEVVCSTTQLNNDSSIYLAGCRVGGRSVDGYTYGSEETVPTPTYTAYNVGDEVSYNGVDYYVIKDSDTTEDSVTLLKAEPLTVDEVNTYGVGHVNKYTSSATGTAVDSNGYGGMAYYTSETCGYVNNEWVETGCKNDYSSSEIKYVVDSWKNVKAPLATEARLMTYDEISEHTEIKQVCTGSCYDAVVLKYDWLKLNEPYWLGTPYTDSTSGVWCVLNTGGLGNGVSNGLHGADVIVRPAIVLPKSAL